MRVQKPKGFKHEREICRRDGCSKPAINGYCSRAHAPYGNLSDAATDYLKYPVDLDEPPHTKHDIHAMACVHQHADSYTCRSVRLCIPREKMLYADRCLCRCHHTSQHDWTDDYE